MIYPTGRAAMSAGACALIALLIAAASPQYWTIGLLVAAVMISMILLDAALTPGIPSLRAEVEKPDQFQIGADDVVNVALTFKRRGAQRVECLLETNDLLDVEVEQPSRSYRLTPLRRGMAGIKGLWVRWRGPLGLIYRQSRQPVDHDAPITANIGAVKSAALNLQLRDGAVGIKALPHPGAGAEFEALKEFQAGMDSRAIDWKQSARHRNLLTREFRIEKNHSITFAIDQGRLMSSPVLDGVTRLDQAINAALIMSFVSLKLGDRVGFMSFDSATHLDTGLLSGVGAFGQIQRQASTISYSEEETNYTLALTQLSTRLDRRNLIVIFTDFADSTSAELMLANLKPILKKHLVLFVAFRDDELETLAHEEPNEPSDVTQAVIAGSLLDERDIVIARLKRIGAQIVDAPADKIGAALINQYLDIKKRGLI